MPGLLGVHTTGSSRCINKVGRCFPRVCPWKVTISNRRCIIWSNHWFSGVNLAVRFGGGYVLRPKKTIAEEIEIMEVDALENHSTIDLHLPPLLERGTTTQLNVQKIMFLQKLGRWKQFFRCESGIKTRTSCCCRLNQFLMFFKKLAVFSHSCRAWSVGRSVLHVGCLNERTYQLAQHLLLVGKNMAWGNKNTFSQMFFHSESSWWRSHIEELPQWILCFPTYSGRFCIPSWELTYPTYGRGKSPSSYLWRDMFVPWRVSRELLFCAKNVHNTKWAPTSCNYGCNSTHRGRNPSYPFIFGHL